MISVVIPAYNAGGFIKRTIDSVLAQTYRDYEVIVVDDGSTDNTADVVKSCAGKVRYIYQENAGDGPARNTGIRAAKGDWIAFLDHDDEWLPQKLELQMKLLDRNPDLRWCGANYYKSCFSRRVAVGNVEALRKALGDRDYFDNFFVAIHKKGCGLITATMIVHTEVFEQVGGFDSCWLRWADLDMWWRIAYRLPKIGYLPQPLAIVHLDVQGAVSTNLRIASKRGDQTWKLLRRHIQMSKEQGSFQEFRPLAEKFLRDSLLTTLYHGYGADSKTTVKEFSEFFPSYWHLATYLLTIFPTFTAAVLHIIAYVGHLLGLEPEVSRRWIRPKRVRRKEMQVWRHTRSDAADRP